MSLEPQGSETEMVSYWHEAYDQRSLNTLPLLTDVAAEQDATFFHWDVVHPLGRPWLVPLRSFVQLEDSFPALAGHMVKSIAAPRKERLFLVQQK